MGDSNTESKPGAGWQRWAGPEVISAAPATVQGESWHAKEDVLSRST